MTADHRAHARGDPSTPNAQPSERAQRDQHGSVPTVPTGQGSSQHATHGAPEGDTVHAGHDKHAGHSVEMFRQKFWGTLLLVDPDARLGADDPALVRLRGARRSRRVALDLRRCSGRSCSPTAAGSSSRARHGELADRRPGMMTLIALAITVAFAVQPRGHARLPGNGSVVGARHARHDHGPRPLGRDALDLAGAGRAEGTGEAASRHRGADRRRAAPRRCPPRTSASGDLVLVRPGASIPADGVVRDGASDVNESMITGESRPVGKSVGGARDRGDGQRLRLAARRGHRHRRADGARRHHAPRRAGADLAFPRAGARRPRRVSRSRSWPSSRRR